MKKQPKTRRNKEDETTATMRRIEMLQRIPWEPASISTSELHRKLETAGYRVELRTVQRDLNALSVAFHYTSEQRGNAMHWFWPRHCQAINIRTINPEAALILSLAEKHLQDLLPASALALLRPYFDQARETLSGQDPKRFGTWTDKVRVISRGPSFAVPKIPDGVQAPVFEALLADRQIKALYKGRNATAAKETVLHPLGIVSRESVIYLVATAWEYSDPYQYALHRFESAELLTDPTKRPEGFDLDRYIADQQEFAYPTGKGQIALKIELVAYSAMGLLERPLSATQTARQLRDGRYRIEATVEDTLELRWWLLGFGAQVKVLAPASLRKDIARTLAEAAAQYTKQTDAKP